MRLISSAEHRTSTWSGGTTTELAIFPSSSSYAARDFEWRLSTAVVTVAKSTFTSLPGYRRLLMVLEGQMKLEHAGQHEVTLLPFEQDSFSGGCLTSCTGTGRDLNLMLAAGWQGSLRAIHLADNDATCVKGLIPHAAEALYCLKGQARILLPDNSALLLREGGLLLQQPEKLLPQIDLVAPGPVDLIHARIWRG